MDVEKTIEFLLGHQTRMATGMEQFQRNMQDLQGSVRELQGNTRHLQENVQQLSTEVRQLSTEVRQLSTEVRRISGSVEQLQSPVVSLQQGPLAMIDVVRRIGEQQEQFIRSTGDRLNRLTESQQRTDEKLDVLVDVVNDLIRRNGRTPPPS